MLEQILREIHNWFVVPDGIHHGTFTVENGQLSLPFLQVNQYFRIIGSIYSDGLHQYPACGLHDETFTGAVWALAVPPAVVALAKEAAAWEEKNGAAAAGPYQSESFGGYSYSRASDAKTGGSVTWKSAFRSQLNQWRKL